jgi:hypothetical protein
VELPLSLIWSFSNNTYSMRPFRGSPTVTAPLQ